ncbi:MAG: translation initiation factor IF-3 [Actinomycetales bacterium]|nr:translation initiation factor IF-3 [Actinomycetales bacterium]
MSEPRINERIRVPEVRLVGPNGEQVGIVRVEEALRLAADADLDLVEVAPMARPPVAKLMDFGKFKYEAALKAREARKNQVNTVIKEIKLRPKIDPHDYGTKKGHVERFLKAGDKVKVTIMFRGREQSRPELGFRLLQRLAEDVVELGFVESAPKQDGRNMIMVIGPTKRKAEAKAEARRARETLPTRAAGPGAGDDSDAQPAAEAPVVVAAAAPEAPEVAVPAAPAAEAAPAPAPRAAAPAAEPAVRTSPAADVATEPAEPASAAATVAAPAVKPAPAPRARTTASPTPSAPTPRPRPAAARPAPPSPRPTPRAPKA